MPDNFEIAFWWVFFLLPLPLLVYWLLPALRIKSASLFLPVYKNALTYTGEKPRKSAWVRRRSVLKWSVLWMVWILLLAALSSPQLVGKPELKVKSSRNFLILCDISFSMAQTDWRIQNNKATRWEAVKEVMHAFIKKRQGDRMGLIFFGSSAYIQAPFSPDLQTIEQLLEEADVGMAGQMTRIGKAITKGVAMFEQDTIKTKVMLLLTDGVDDGTDILPLDAAELARKDSVLIYTIGIGDPATPGSDLDEKTLQEIADLTGGQYFLAKNTDTLEQIYAELDALEPIEFEEKEHKPVTHLYLYPLGAAVGLLLFVTTILSLINSVKAFKKQTEEYV